MSRSRRQDGFTLIEMLVVLAILGILAGMARPLLELSVQRQKEHELRTALRTIRTALDAYKQAVDAGSIAAKAGSRGYPPDLQSLVRGVEDARSANSRKFYFLRSLPRDPFADPSVAAEDSWAPRASDSPPEAPAAGSDVFDVHSKSAAQALNGTRYSTW